MLLPHGAKHSRALREVRRRLREYLSELAEGWQVVPMMQECASFSGDTGMCLNMLNSRTSRGVHTHALTSATVSPDGEHIVTASEDCTACVWRLSDSYSPSVWLRRLGVSFAGVGGSPPGGGGPLWLGELGGGEPGQPVCCDSIARQDGASVAAVRW